MQDLSISISVNTMMSLYDDVQSQLKYSDEEFEEQVNWIINITLCTHCSLWY